MGTMGKEGGKKSVRMSQLPTKRTINFAEVGEKPINLLVAIPAIILIILGAALVSKFAVIDRMAEVSAAQAENQRIQHQIDSGYAEIDSFGDLSKEYAHYTFSGMTLEELQLPDRIEAAELIRRVAMPEVDVTSWALNGNVMSLPVQGMTLFQINDLMAKLQKDEFVDYCTLSSATSSTGKDVTNYESISGDTIVTAQISVYLKQKDVPAAMQNKEEVGDESTEP